MVERKTEVDKMIDVRGGSVHLPYQVDFETTDTTKSMTRESTNWRGQSTRRAEQLPRCVSVYCRLLRQVC